MIVRVTNLTPWNRSVPTPANISIPIAGSATIEFKQPKALEWFFEGLNEQSYNFRVELTTTPDEIIPANPDLDFEKLDELITEGNDLKNSTFTSVDGLDVYVDEKWVPREFRIDLINMIQIAIKTKEYAKTQEEVDDIVTRLTAEINVFKRHIKDGLKLRLSNLESAIDDAVRARRGIQVSEDGLDIEPDQYWVTKEQIDAFDEALQAARKVRNNPRNQEEINQAESDLRSAIETFRSAIQAGTKEKLDFTELEKLISEAHAETADVIVSEDGSDVLTTQKWTTQDNLDTFNAAIEVAEGVKETAKRQSEIESAIETLNQAKEAFTSSLQDGSMEPKEELDYESMETEISRAKSYINDITISEDGKDVTFGSRWVTSEEMDAFKQAIQAAQNAMSTVETQEDLDSAKRTLTEAIETFTLQIQEAIAETSELEASIHTAQSTKNGTNSSSTGADVPFGAKWTTQENVEALETAIETAIRVRSTAQRQSELDAAKAALDSAVEAFNETVQTSQGDTSELDALIEECNQLKDSVIVSKNGKDVKPSKKWAKSGDVGVFNTAIKIATEAKTSAKTQKDIEQAVVALQSAKQAFENVCYFGLKEMGPVGEFETSDFASTIGSHQIQDFINIEDFSVDYDPDEHRIVFTGTVNQILNADDIFPVEAKFTNYFVPVKLRARDGAILTSVTLTGNIRTLTFGKTNDPQDTMLLVLAVDPESAEREISIKPENQDVATTYILDFSQVTFDGFASFVNTAKIVKWGFVPNKTSLDEVVGEGQSSNIDHDSNVFYLQFSEKLTDGNHYSAEITTLNGTYSVVLADYTYHYFSLQEGAQHQTDADFVNKGISWEPATESYDVTGKPISLCVYKYDQEVTAEVLEADNGELVFGTQYMLCNAIRSYVEIDTSELDSVVSEAEALLDVVTSSDTGEGPLPDDDRVWYVSAEKYNNLETLVIKGSSLVDYPTSQEEVTENLTALRAAIEDVKSNKKSFILFSVAPYKDNTGIGNKTAGELQTDIQVHGTKITGTVKYAKGFIAGGRTLAGNYLALEIKSTNPKATILSTLQRGDSRVSFVSAEKYRLIQAIPDMSGYKLIVNQTTEGNDTGTPDQIVEYDLSELIIEENPNAIDLVVSAPGNDETFYGLQAQQLQSDLKVRYASLHGTLHHVTGYIGFDSSNPENQEGYFVALKFSVKSGTITTQVIGGSGNVTTVTDGYCVYHITAKNSQKIQVTVRGNDDETVTETYSLKGLMLEFDTTELDKARTTIQTMLQDTAESEDGSGVEDKLWYASADAIDALREVYLDTHFIEQNGEKQSDIDDAVATLNEAIETFKAARKSIPAFKVEVPEGTVTIGGKQVSELQSLQIEGNAITGNVSYVTEFTPRVNPESGQYIILKITPTDENAKISSVIQLGKANLYPFQIGEYSEFKLTQTDMTGGKLIVKQITDGNDSTKPDAYGEYTLDGITVKEGPALPAFIFNAKAADRSKSFLGKNYSDLVGENFHARVLGNDIIASGDVIKCAEWEQNTSANGKYCIPVTVTATAGNVMGKADKDWNYTFESETDDIIWQFGDNTETQFILYNNEEDYNSKTNGNTYTVSIAKCRLIDNSDIDMTELDEVISEIDTELKDTAISSDGSNTGNKVWYASKEAIQALKGAEKQYAEAFKVEDQAAVEAAVIALNSALETFNASRKSVPCYELAFPDAVTEIGNKTAQELQTNVQLSETDVTGTLNWVDGLTIEGATLNGNFFVFEPKSTNAKAKVVGTIKRDSVIGATTPVGDYQVFRTPASLAGYTIELNQTTDGNTTGKPDQTISYDISKLVVSADPTPAPTLKISAPEGTEEFYGTQAQLFQTGITKSITNRVVGTLSYMTNMGGFSGDEAKGYFLALKFETNGTKITTEITNGAHPGEVDATEDKYCVYRITDPTNQVINVTAELNGETTKYSISLKNLTLLPYIKSVDIAGQEESWKGVTYKDLMSPNFTATLTDKTIKLHGDLYQCFGWEAFGADLQNKWYVVMGVVPSVDCVIGINKINDTVGTADVTTDGEDLVLAFDEEHKTSSIVVYANKADADKKKNGTTYQLDASTSLFLPSVDTTELQRVITEARKLLDETTKFDTGGANLENKIWYVGSDWWKALDKAVTENEQLTSIKDHSRQGEIDAAVSAIQAAIDKFNSDKRANVLFHVDAVPQTTEIGGKLVAEIQSDVKVSYDKITGTSHFLMDLDGDKQGNYLALQYKAHRSEIFLTHEVKHKENDTPCSTVQVGDYELISATEGDKLKLVVTQSVNGADPKYNVTREYDLSDIVWEPYQLKPAFVNTINATKWGFAKTNAELDTLIEPGESAKIDHDTDIFYAVYTKPEHNVVMIITVDGIQYACICDGANGSLVGAGASTSGHATDFVFKSTDGQTWTTVDSAVEVAGKVVTMNLYTYSEDVTKENAPTVLATEGTLVLGSQLISCSESSGFDSFVNTINAEKWGYLKNKADADRIDGGQSSSVTHDNNIFFYKLKTPLEADGKKYATLIKVDDKTYAALHSEDTYQYVYASLDETTDAALVSSDNGATWTAVSGSEDVTGKSIDLSVVKASEDITPENGATVLKTASKVFGVQDITCDQTLILSGTKYVSFDDLKDLNVGKLKQVAKNLGISTTSRKAGTLINKIKQANPTVIELTDAVNSIVK